MKILVKSVERGRYSCVFCIESGRVRLTRNGGKIAIAVAGKDFEVDSDEYNFYALDKDAEILGLQKYEE